MGNIRHSAHWGAFTAQVDDGRVVGVEPFKEDPNPTPILKGMAEALYHDCRVAEPMIRKGALTPPSVKPDAKRSRYCETFGPT